MKISVIIPTYNGVYKIVNALRSLEKQTRSPDQVIVVIDGSTDGTLEMLGQEKFGLKDLKIIDQRNGGRAKVRNNGAREAVGELLIFLDDDMIASPDCIYYHEQHHFSHNKCILTGGLREPKDHLRNDFSAFKSWLNDRWNVPLMNLKDQPMSADNYFVTAGNCSVPRIIFDQLGGFDERLKDAEDYDLATRALLFQVPLYFSERAWAYHNETVTCRQYIKRLRQYSAVQGQLSSIKPELYGTTHKYKIATPAGTKALIFKALCSNFWINSVDNRYWSWLPKQVRFKLYDLIITANGSFYTDRVQL